MIAIWLIGAVVVLAILWQARKLGIPLDKAVRMSADEKRKAGIKI